MNNKHKKVIIFGASQGIGKALALEYAKHGCSLVLGSRNEAALEEITEEIISKNGKCFYKKCDVSITENVKDFINFSLEKLGTIDLAVINSGIGGPNWMSEFSSEQLIKMFEINTFGIARALEFLIPIMKKQGHGTIAGVTSLADVRGYGGSSSYTSSKAAASILLEAARVELKKENINVITVKPGFVKTAMTDKNEFYMPFIMNTDKAARLIRKGIEKGKSIVQFPFGTVNSTRLIKNVPNWLYDWGMNAYRPAKKKK